MENKLENDRLISSHRNKSDYQESPENSLQFAYQHRRFDKFTLELARASDVLKTKVLTELNEDVRQADKINLMLLSSDILTVLISLLQNPDDTIRELTSSILVGALCQLLPPTPPTAKIQFHTHLCQPGGESLIPCTPYEHHGFAYN